MSVPYKTVKELLEAAKAGELPEDFSLVLDNDAVYGYVIDEEDEDDQVEALTFDFNPREFLEEVLEVLGIPTTRP